MASKAKFQKPWPRNAEGHRRAARDGATEARELGTELRQTLDKATAALDKRNLTLTELLIAKATTQAADMQTLLADIVRELEVARIGIEPAESDEDDDARDSA